jgi:hypothetical protein
VVLYIFHKKAPLTKLIITYYYFFFESELTIMYSLIKYHGKICSVVWISIAHAMPWNIIVHLSSKLINKSHLQTQTLIIINLSKSTDLCAYNGDKSPLPQKKNISFYKVCQRFINFSIFLPLKFFQFNLGAKQRESSIVQTFFLFSLWN